MTLFFLISFNIYLYDIQNYRIDSYTVAIALSLEESDVSDYETEEDIHIDDKTDTVSEESDSDTETSSNSSEDEIDVTIPQSVSLMKPNTYATTAEATPVISIAHTPRRRAPPARPIEMHRRPKPSLSHAIAVSTPTRAEGLSRKHSEGSLSSHLSVPSSTGKEARPRSGSYSDVLVKPLSQYTGHKNVDSSSGPSSPILLNSASWSSSIAANILHSLPEKEKKRQEAIHELIVTEQVYLSNLLFVKDDFQSPLLDQGLISSAESQSIFMDWTELLDLSKSIVAELVERQTNGEGVVLAVGDVINSHIVEKANCFMRYCANHRLATKLLTQRMTESKPLLNFLTQAKSKPACRGLDIFSFLLQPLQRITRYPLLIKKILASTDEDHIDHLLLMEALMSAEKFLDRINEAIRSGETKERLEDIQCKMTNVEMSAGLTLTSDTKYLGPRVILHEGQLRKAKSGRKLYAYLCNDLLLLFIPGRYPGALVKSSPHSALTRSNSSTSYGLSDRVSGIHSAIHYHGWSLYQPPISLERVRVHTEPSDNIRFTIVVSASLSDSLIAQQSFVPLHLQSAQQQRQSSGSLIQLKAGSAKDRNVWIKTLEKAIKALAKAPRDYITRTSIRPPLSETVGTMTIRVNEGVIPSREFAKSKSFICSISLGEQLFTTRPVATDNAYSGVFSILWRESVIFALTDMNQVLHIRVTSSTPFAPDALMGSTQLQLHTVIPYGERGTEVIASFANNIEVKFFMSYRTL
ncbi:hypothetical protein BCR41DRAFT_168920 [Lobosporangium transversale]|uniref:Dbl homology domain-containing protein n=1 Tax=Lobosporangium transversale TaxID=64571 RepID=A0A1Y2GBJ9_9FUNG|nr:hypothetical protein BCR41DRAFT_168920 [Lobosporangium transversale]ORZ06331.1 hypothetical protein BCR41DRAFT_168920 [Lobosporangium transversale]|eukprot:XP_021877494.1 hypothetical protein BCR41DRAFT_168920 [Lobosporangium transversale]